MNFLDYELGKAGWILVMLWIVFLGWFWLRIY
jgi:hypothetical protein